MWCAFSLFPLHLTFFLTLAFSHYMYTCSNSVLRKNIPTAARCQGCPNRNRCFPPFSSHSSSSCAVFKGASFFFYLREFDSFPWTLIPPNGGCRRTWRQVTPCARMCEKPTTLWSAGERGSSLQPGYRQLCVWPHQWAQPIKQCSYAAGIVARVVETEEKNRPSLSLVGCDRRDPFPGKTAGCFTGALQALWTLWAASVRWVCAARKHVFSPASNISLSFH